MAGIIRLLSGQKSGTGVSPVFLFHPLTGETPVPLFQLLRPSQANGCGGLDCLNNNVLDGIGPKQL